MDIKAAAACARGRSGRAERSAEFRGQSGTEAGKRR